MHASGCTCTTRARRRGANVCVALQMGVRLFDVCRWSAGARSPVTSRRGKWRAIFAPRIAVFMCQELGIETGIDLSG